MFWEQEIIQETKNKKRIRNILIKDNDFLKTWGVSIFNLCYKMSFWKSNRILVKRVNRKGILTGKNHFENPFFMQSQLEKEGVQVLNDQIVDFDFHFWDPNKELTI